MTPLASSGIPTKTREQPFFCAQGSRRMRSTVVPRKQCRRRPRFCSAPPCLRVPNSFSRTPRLLRLDLHVRSWRVAQRFQLAVAGLARRHFLSRQLRQPRIPVRPPGAGMFGRAGLPVFDLRRQFVVGPVLIFFCRGRVDDARDVTRARDDEADRSLEELRRFVDRAERRDVVVLGRIADRPGYSPSKDRVSRHRRTSRPSRAHCFCRTAADRTGESLPACASCRNSSRAGRRERGRGRADRC